MHQCLVEGGWLAVGHAEPNTTMFSEFRVVNTAGAILYQKPVGRICNPSIDPVGRVSNPSVDPEGRIANPSYNGQPWTPPVLPDFADLFGGTQPEAVPAARDLPVPVAEIAAIRALADPRAARCRPP